MKNIHSPPWIIEECFVDAVLDVVLDQLDLGGFHNQIRKLKIFNQEEMKKKI